jgi:MOSC domain-containing protein YiiM
VTIVHRPEHEVTIELAFRAFTLEPDLLPQLTVATALPDEDKEKLRRRLR